MTPNFIVGRVRLPGLDAYDPALGVEPSAESFPGAGGVWEIVEHHLVDVVEGKVSGRDSSPPIRVVYLERGLGARQVEDTIGGPLLQDDSLSTDEGLSVVLGRRVQGHDRFT